MGVSLKTENEDWTGKDLAEKGQRRRAAKFHRTSKQSIGWLFPGALRPPHHSLKLEAVLWLLRCSVLRETPMTSAINVQFKKLKCYS